MRYLEERIAALESSVTSSPCSLRSAESLYQHSRADGPSLSGGISHALLDTTTSFLGLTQHTRLAGCVVAPTKVPSAKDSFSLSDLDENNPRTILNQQPSHLSPTSVPVQVARFLFSTYITRIIHQYPFYHVSDVEQAFSAIFPDGCDRPIPESHAEARDIYIVSLIMAISLSTAARNKQAHAHGLATGLFKKAMLQVPAVLSNDLSGLQALLLLIQYTFLNPSVANLWLLTGVSSEACFDMGLHKDLPDGAIDVASKDLRRRIFWCAWEMEVAVSAGFQRPIRTLNKYINVPFPTEYDDRAVHQHGIATTGPKVKFVSRRIWLFRQIESEIISILYQDEPLPTDSMSLDQWLIDVDKRISQWRHEVHQSAAQNQDDPLVKLQWDEISLYTDIAYHYILVLMYGPSPRLKSPPRRNLIKAFEAGVKVATGYWEQANTEFGKIKYVFHPCYHTFSSAVVFLKVLQSCKADIAHLYTSEEVEDYALCFSRLFSTIAERWPAATLCLEEFDRLWGTVKKEYADFLQLKEINSLTQTWLGHSVSPDDLDDTTDISGDLNFMPFFNTYTTTTESDWNTAWTVMPNDWNAEFNFGMDFTDSVGA